MFKFGGGVRSSVSVEFLDMTSETERRGGFFFSMR